MYKLSTQLALLICITSVIPPYVIDAAYDEQAYHKLATKLYKKGLHTYAAQSYKQAFTCNSDHYPHAFNAASNFFRNNQLPEALALYTAVLKIAPKCHQAHFNLGLIHKKMGNLDKAVEAFSQSIITNPHYIKAYLSLANTLKEQEKIAEACRQLHKLLGIDSQNYDAHINLAGIYGDLHQFDQSLNHYHQALAAKPHDTSALLGIANKLSMINRTDEALSYYKKLLAIHPANVSILYNIAYTLKKQGKVAEAMTFYKKVLDLKPSYQTAHFGYSLAHLVSGNFQDGWKEYEWRKKPRTLSQPEWDGSDLNGKRILLHAEQGLGDTYQFIRYAEIAKQKGGTVIVAVQKPLKRIMQNCPYIDTVIALDEKVPPFDVQCLLMSMPYHCQTHSEEEIPKKIPYLYPDDELVAYWKEQLAHDTNFKVGICWQGNANYSTPFLRHAVAAKSIQLKQFESLANIERVSLYSLQRVTGEDQLSDLPEGFNIHTFDNNFDNEHGRFMDTAAVMKNLDLIITIDTSTAHLAGGLGVPVWLLLPNPPDWRWMLERSDTPWYPTMRLFRQPKPDSWQPVIDNIYYELKTFLLLQEIHSTENNQ